MNHTHYDGSLLKIPWIFRGTTPGSYSMEKSWYGYWHSTLPLRTHWKANEPFHWVSMGLPL